MNLTTLRKLTYEEVARCNRCGFCLPNCPVYTVRPVESASPRGRNAITRAVIEGDLQWSREVERSIFSCLGCGACTAVCFPSIPTREVVLQDRECLVDEGFYPSTIERLATVLDRSHNISDEDNEERGDWREDLRDVPEHRFEKPRAELVYFVGCVSSFFPMAQPIPVHMARIMERAGVDFTILGGDEWCCGLPLLAAGMPGRARKLMEHNLQRVAETGAKKILFSCPSCYHTWKTVYRPEAQILSVSELLQQLISERRTTLREKTVLATYHDPCDLGRNSGVFEAPREVLQAIPGLRLVELANNRSLSLCCGGGGNLEMVDPELSAQVAQMKIDEIVATGAEMVVTSCQQCLRTISTRARRQGIELPVRDLSQLVAEVLG